MPQRSKEHFSGHQKSTQEEAQTICEQDSIRTNFKVVFCTSDTLLYIKGNVRPRCAEAKFMNVQFR
jgi:hypothetical protein